jgi:glutathione synthase/RimK-type ligase-like ATP-grasp enzyme
MTDTGRMLAKILRDVCAHDGITLEAFSGDWVFRLEREGRVAHVFGYDFALNSATAHLLAKDKAATSTLLTRCGVPCVEHALFLGPQAPEHMPRGGNWRALTAFFERHGRDIVCKRNDGTGGADVLRVRTPVELEVAAQRIFARSRALCASPYVSIEREVRVVVLRGRCEVVYEKTRPTVVGDGVSTPRALLAKHIADGADIDATAAALTELAGHTDWDAPLAAGASLTLNWKHNLGQGAEARVLDDADPQLPALRAMALRAAEAIGVTLASVDIALVGERLQVLEINAGLMMESFARRTPGGYDTARRIYRRAARLSLGLSDLDDEG